MKAKLEVYFALHRSPLTCEGRTSDKTENSNKNLALNVKASFRREIIIVVPQNRFLTTVFVWNESLACVSRSTKQSAVIRHCQWVEDVSQLAMKITLLSYHDCIDLLWNNERKFMLSTYKRRYHNVGR